MQRMSTSVNTNTTHDGSTEQRQVSHQVKYLMANKLIAKPKTAWVHHPVSVEHHRVAQRPAQAKTGPLQRFDFFKKTERASAGDFFLKYCWIQPIDLNLLHTDGRMFEIDAVRNLEVTRRFDTDRTAFRAKFNFTVNTQHRLHFVLLVHTRSLNEVNESFGAPVHHRNFGAVDSDNRIVDLQPVERSEKVFNRGHTCVATAESRGMMGRTDRTRDDRRFVFNAIGMAYESNARIHARG